MKNIMRKEKNQLFVIKDITVYGYQNFTYLTK